MQNASPGGELDPDAVAGADAAAGELARRPRGLPQQLRVGQAVDRGAIRMARGRAREPGVDEHGRQSSLPRMSVTWTAAGEYDDIRYELSGDGIAKITINRPEVRNAFRPQTLFELREAFDARAGRPDRRRHRPHRRGRRWPSAPAATSASAATTATSATTPSPGRASGGSTSSTCRSRSAGCPKPIVAMVAGYAIGGGHVLHVCCDLTIAADNARFGQTGPKVGSFDGGFGSGLLARQIGQKRAKEVWFLCRQYDARTGARLGPRQRRRAARAPRGGDRPVVPRDARAVAPGAADAEGVVQRGRGRPRGHPAARRRRHLLFYMSDEAQEGRDAYGRSAARLLEVPAAAVAGRDEVAPVRIWLMAARPRTLPAAIAPVLVGTALAVTEVDLRVGGFIAALLGAIFIQVGTNLSNDYSDARRGADTEERLGPVRVTAGGLVPPRQVLVATYVSFGLAVAVRRVPRLPRGPDPARDRRRVDPRGRPLHRRPAAVRLRGPRRGLRVPVLRHRRGRRLVLRPDREGRVGGVRARRPGRAARVARSSSSTTCATSRPTGARASARSRSGSGGRGRGRCSA